MVGLQVRLDTHIWLLVSFLDEIAGLHKLKQPGVALSIASYAIGRVADLIYRRYKAKHDGKAPPAEKRLDMQVWAYMLTAAGKAMFGWFVVKNFHPAAGLVATAICKFCQHLV